MNNVWVVGQFRGHMAPPDYCVAWDLIGVFSSKDLAIAACLDRDFFIGPVTQDVSTTADATWDGCEYPHGTFTSEQEYQSWLSSKTVPHPGVTMNCRGELVGDPKAVQEFKTFCGSGIRDVK